MSARVAAILLLSFAATAEAQPLVATNPFPKRASDPFECNADRGGIGYSNTSTSPYVPYLCDGTSWSRVALGTLNPFDDSTAIIKGSADPTKLFSIEVDGFTAGQNRKFTPGDFDMTITGTAGAKTITLNGNPTLADWFDQSVKVAATPTLGGLTLTNDLAGGASGAGTAAYSFKKTMSGASATSNWLNVTGTLPSSLSAGAHGGRVDVTGAGSSAQPISALTVLLNSGFTGQAAASAFRAENTSRSWGGSAGLGLATLDLMAAGVFSARPVSIGQAGGSTSVGVFAEARGQNTTGDIGIGHLARADNSVTNVGVWGNAGTTGTRHAGGYFEIGDGSHAHPYQNVGWTTAALIANNNGNAVDIFCALDNGTVVFCVNDGGAVNMGATQLAQQFLLFNSGTNPNSYRVGFGVQGGELRIFATDAGTGDVLNFGTVAAADGTTFTAASSLNLETGTLVGSKHSVEAVTGTKTPGFAESGESYTNTGDTDGSTITLTNDPTIGTHFWMTRATAAQTVTVQPSAGETLNLGASACGTSITLDTNGARLYVEAATGGSGAAWYASCMTGTCTCS